MCYTLKLSNHNLLLHVKFSVIYIINRKNRCLKRKFRTKKLVKLHLKKPHKLF